jgi:hypothetical protein
MLRWPQGACHAEYDNNTSAYFLCDSANNRLHPEPFKLKKQEEGESYNERFAEMIVAADNLGMSFSVNPELETYLHEGIQNPVSKFSGGVKKSPAVVVDDEDEDDEEEEVVVVKKTKRVVAVMPPPVIEEDDEDEDEFAE